MRDYVDVMRNACFQERETRKRIAAFEDAVRKEAVAEVIDYLSQLLKECIRDDRLIPMLKRRFKV